MTITTAEYCMQGMHYVPKEKMTVYHTGKMKRRICVDCKAGQKERRKAKKRAGCDD